MRIISKTQQSIPLLKLLTLDLHYSWWKINCFLELFVPWTSVYFMEHSNFWEGIENEREVLRFLLGVPFMDMIRVVL